MCITIFDEIIVPLIGHDSNVHYAQQQVNRELHILKLTVYELLWNTFIRRNSTTTYYLLFNIS